MSCIVALGVGANYMFPEMRVPAPWTIFLLIITGALCSSFYAFTGAAKYSSLTLAAENHRFSRYKEPIRFVSDGLITWAAVPIKGWNFLRTFVNSGKNPAIAICPAEMLEQESEYYTIARCNFYHLTSRAVEVLMRKKSFNRLLTELGYSPARKMEVYLGFQSGTLHPDATHVRSPSDMAAYARSLATDERLYSQGSVDLANQLNRQLELWQRIQGSETTRAVVRHEEEPKQQ